MTSRLVFESWQIILPAVGFLIFSAVFIGVVFRAGKMKRSSIEHLQNLPLEEESPRPDSHDR